MQGKKCEKRERDLQIREAAAQDVKRKADELMAQATALKADLERRAELIRNAAAA